MKSQKAFTIVEIIFIIVIISILALVAIPRLSLTRDDAKISIALNHLGTLINDLSVYYTSKDKFSSNIKDMTFITQAKYTTPWDESIQKGIISYYTLDDNGEKEACVDFYISNADGNLTVKNVSDPMGTICKDLQSIESYRKLLGQRLLGGNRIYF